MLPPLRDYPFALRPMIAAHRGATAGGLMENGLEAIEAALLSGAEMIEIDVQWTLDEIFVCYHDESVENVAGKKRLIHATNAVELLAIEHDGHAAVTRLADIVALAKGRAYLNLEIKEYSARNPQSFMQALAALIRSQQMEDQVLFSSFRIEYVREVPWNIPSVIIHPTDAMFAYFAQRSATPITVDKGLEMMLPSEVMRISQATCYACQLSELTPAAMEDIRRHNLFLTIYTITSPEEFRQAAAAGAKAVVCDDAAEIAIVRNHMFPPKR
jgi:glycerophosphoryl diester phosphodiesterase